ncbi:hypothetical protein, partial [Paracoccus sp. (in: a-proteobacteria)]|uniref:hypothetical protein n=1 Tax=Paracoccus sp. TaxID=267 RepID=UPI003A835F6D
DHHHPSGLLPAQEASHLAVPSPRATVSGLKRNAPLIQKHQPAQPHMTLAARKKRPPKSIVWVKPEWAMPCLHGAIPQLHELLRLITLILR